MPKQATKTHVIWTDYRSERAYWQCSCGRSGSCAEWKADLHSDEHIDYDAGDRRVDRHRG
jgi:hypothetical protein